MSWKDERYKIAKEMSTEVNRPEIFDWDDVLNYAYRVDCLGFFFLLKDKAGENSCLDDILNDYASEHEGEIKEFLNWD